MPRGITSRNIVREITSRASVPGGVYLEHYVTNMEENRA
jgi:hypothetical protein